MSMTSRESDRFMLRLPDGMRDQIKEIAAASGRSMNAEIVYLLQSSLALDVSDHWVVSASTNFFAEADTTEAVRALAGYLGAQFLHFSQSPGPASREDLTEYISMIFKMYGIPMPAAEPSALDERARRFIEQAEALLEYSKSEQSKRQSGKARSRPPRG